MPRKVWFAALVLVLLLAACGSKTPPPADERNPGFVPQVVDFLDDVGFSPSIALDKDGNPHISYLGFVQVLTPAELKAGKIPPARPLTAPLLPAVLVSSQQDGIWTHGAAAQSSGQATGPKVNISRADQTAMTVDEEGAQHVAWTELSGLFYNDDSSGSFPDEPQQVAKGYPFGPSIVLDQSGTPMVAYYLNDTIQVSTLKGKKWSAETVATVGTCPVPEECPPDRTAIAMRWNGPVIAYTDPVTREPVVATNAGGGWSTETVAKGVEAYGIALALGPDGGPRLSYLTSKGEAVVAAFDGTSWTQTVVARFPVSDPQDLKLGTAIGLDGKGKLYVAFAEPSKGVHVAQSSDGSSFEPVPTVLTDTGEFPTIQVTPDGKMYLAWFDRVQQDLLLGVYPEKELGFIARPSPSGSAGASGPPSAPAQACPKGAVTEVAPPNALADGFQNTELSAPAGKPFQLCFQNQDVALHNVTIYQSQDQFPGGQPLAKTEDLQGPGATGTTTVDALAKGSYFFLCTFHPTTMTGTLTAK
jgi:plastocyanin